MPHDIDPPLALLEPRKRRWILLCAACLVVATAQVALNTQETARQRVWNAKWQQIVTADNALRSKVEALVNQLIFQTPKRDYPTLGSAEPHLLKLGMLERRTNDGMNTVMLTDPNTGGRVELRLTSDDRLLNGQNLVDYSTDPRVGRNPNAGATLAGTVTFLRRAAFWLGFVAWPIYFAQFLVLARNYPAVWRRTTATTLLELSLVSTFLAFLGPHYGQAWNRVFNEDSAGWGLVEIAGSVLTLVVCHIVAKRTALDATPRCEACGYDLTGNQSGVCPECGKSAVALRAV